MSEYLLGVTPTKPGSVEIQINPPALSKLGLKFVRGTFPTPHGVLQINNELINNKVQTNVKAPSKIKIIINKGIKPPPISESSRVEYREKI